MGDGNLIVNWMNGKWKINKQKFRGKEKKTQNMMDKTDFRPMGDHLDVLQHLYRDWNQEVAREKGATWNPHVVEEGTRVEAVRSFFDGGLNDQSDDKIKHKV